MATDIDSLQISIGASSKEAVDGLKALEDVLTKVKSAVGGGLGLRGVASQLGKIEEAGNKLSSSTAEKIRSLGEALEKLKDCGKVTLSSTIAKQIPEIGKAANEMPADIGTRLTGLSSGLQSLSNIQGITISSTIASGISNIASASQQVDVGSLGNISALATSVATLNSISDVRISSSIAHQLTDIGVAGELLQDIDLTVFMDLAFALEPLTQIGEVNLTPIIRQLNRLPELERTLNGVDWDRFREQIQQLCESLAPLATQLGEVGTGFANLPENVRNLIQATDTLTNTNERATRSYVNLWARLRIVINGMRRMATTIASWIDLSNKYIEDMNLFNVALGKYAQEAQNYAEKVSDIMGIDPADWMRNQGVFNTIIKGFGVTEDKAYTMSKNLTQLGYDLSSFYNISVSDAMTKLQSGIAGELEPLRRLGYDLSVARLQEEALALGITKKVSKMNQAQKSQLRYYAIMTQVTDAQGDMARTLEAPANQLRIFKAQLTQVARALGNLFIPLLNMVLPYLIAIAKVLRTIIEYIAGLFNIKIPEVDYSSLDGASDATEGLGDSASDTNDKLKKLKRTIMGFDELNVLKKAKDSDSDGDALGSGDLGIELPTYDFLGDAVQTKIDDIVSKIKNALWEITTVISGFLLALGTILVVTGANIPVGLALMAAGAIGLGYVISVNWNGMTDRLAKVLSIVTGVLGGFLLAIGAFLTFTGANVGLGIALMAVGAASLVTAAVINWNFLNGDLKATLALLTAIVSGALLGLGALFAFTGVNVPLGIAMMVAGAAGLVTAVGLNWDILPQQIKTVLTSIMAIVGGAMLALGAAFAFTSVDIPLGIALMAAGAVALISAATLNWDTLRNNISATLTLITGVVSGALLAIGAVLAFSGAGSAIGLGIALMAAGAIGLVTTVAMDWGLLPANISETVQKISTYLGTALFAVGAALAFSGVNPQLGLGLMAAGAMALFSGAVIDWNGLTSNLERVLQTVTKVLCGAMLAIGAVLAFTHVSLPLGIGLMAAGAVGLISSVALDWDFLGGKINGVLKTITTIASAAALALGIILTSCHFFAVGIPLLVAGAATLVTSVALHWDEIVNKVKEVLKAIGIAAGAALLALGVILVAACVSLPVGIALIAAGATSLAAGVALNWDAVVQKISSFFQTVARLFTGVALIALGLLLCGTGAGLPLGIGLIKAGASALTKPETFNVQSLVKIGLDAINGVKQGVENGWKAFKEFWEGIFKSAVDWVKNFLGIHSPSTVFESIGSCLVAGLQNGLKNIGQVFTNVFKTVGDWIGNFGKNMYNWGSDMMSNMVTGINSGLQSLANKVRDAANTIRSFLHFTQPDVGPLSDFNTWMPDMMSQLAEGIEDNEEKVRKAMAGLAGDMDLQSMVDANVSVNPDTSAVEDDNAGLVSAVYSAVTSALSAMNGEDSETPIIINLGNEQIASFMVKQNKRVALISGGRA